MNGRRRQAAEQGADEETDGRPGAEALAAYLSDGRGAGGEAHPPPAS